MKKLIIIILTIMISCCTNKNEDGASTEYKLIVLDSLVINLEASSVCCNDSLIFIAERFGNDIACYDYEGRKKFSFGGQGSGPGEFIHTPANIALWQNLLVAADIPQFELELFNLDGSYNRTVSYVEHMISPVYNIAPRGEKLIIEGLSLNIEGKPALLHKIISINDSFQIKVESIKVGRRITSFNDMFTELNPFEMGKTYFPLGNSTAKIISDDALRIYNKFDSTDISLQSIPLIKVNKDIINYFKTDPDTKAMEKQGLKISFSFPKYLPKINNVFKLDNNILILSEEQYISNEIGETNNIYIYDEKKSKFINIAIPDNIPVSKILTTYDSRIFLNYDDRIKIMQCKINHIP
jgi:hypothetical protein